MMLSTAFTELVGCRVPIQQAGMGGVAGPGLAAAVADAGGLGMVSMVFMPADEAGAALDALAGRPPDGGAECADPFLDRDVVAVAASRVRVVEFFYADPDPALIRLVHDGGALAAWQVGSLTEARAAADVGCDFIIVQGTEAGGHVRGQVSLLPLLESVLGAVDVPVVAAGGIATARGVAAVLPPLRRGAGWALASLPPARPTPTPPIPRPCCGHRPQHRPDHGLFRHVARCPAPGAPVVHPGRRGRPRRPRGPDVLRDDTGTGTEVRGALSHRTPPAPSRPWPCTRANQQER